MKMAEIDAPLGHVPFLSLLQKKSSKEEEWEKMAPFKEILLFLLH